MEIHFPYPALNSQLVFLRTAKECWQKLATYKNSPVLCDSGVKKFLPAAVRKRAFFLPNGEACKDWQELGRVLLWLAEQKVERNTPLVVIGGGAACDLGALAASLYRRGMPLVLVPTTLLAQLDAAVGGKTAVDYRNGKKLFKNFAGTFYPAQKILSSIHWLESLPLREKKSGLGELLKTFYLSGKDLHDLSLRNWLEYGTLDKKFAESIAAAVGYKARLVEQDPLDNKRIREALNYGHTVGHALEAIAGGTLSHGEAIALGCFLETAFFEKKKAFSASIQSRLESLGFHCPIAKPRESALLDYFLADKKMRRGKLEMSVVTAPGKIQKVQVSPKALAKFVANCVSTRKTNSQE